MKILLAEHDPDEARRFRAMMKAAPPPDFRIVRVESISGALRRISEDDIDVVVTELDLLDSSGSSTVARLCSEEPGVPVIVLTGRDDGELEMQALREGAQDYIVKGSESFDILERAIRHAIQRKQLDWQLRLARRRLRILHDTVSKLGACGGRNEAFKTAVESVRLLFPGTICRVLTEKSGMLTIVTASPELADGIGERFRLDFGLESMTYAENRTIRFDSRGDMPPVYGMIESLNSGISIPVGSRGVFQCFSSEPGTFRADEANVLEMLAGYLAETTDRIALQNKLRNLAIHDPLTGAFNRNFFQMALRREQLRAQRYESNIGFLMADIDNFKDINDVHGHLMGDRILREVAEYLSGSIRETDYLIRYGGDEFLVILIESGQTAAVVRERIQRDATKLAERTKSLIGRPVTLSIGHSHWNPESGMSIREILAEADRSMFEAKKGS